MESPTIKVVGGKSGRGDCLTGEKYVGGGGELAEEDNGDEMGGTRATGGMDEQAEERWSQQPEERCWERQGLEERGAMAETERATASRQPTTQGRI
ncbi:Hypothetical predicted protein [Xyrichtys novacula]|uniref:Uncharacterized protein n=1 Tax=Xyrichtys novacula TaxID=13765 RepID=A0AAV1H7M9_XYRNO|nr:Hypothetical predicted protein [Xyrichtys novacula]